MKNIIVLVSGGGTNLQALLEAEQAGAFPGGSITCVISSRGDAYALRRAEQFHVKSRVIAKKDYPDFSAYTDAMMRSSKMVRNPARTIKSACSSFNASSIASV